MFRRFILCVAVAAGVAVAVAGSCSTAEARGCYQRSYSSGQHYSSSIQHNTRYYHGGHHTYYRSTPAVYHHGYNHGYHHGNHSYPIYYGGQHGSHYGGSNYGYRSGISFSVGF